MSTQRQTDEANPQLYEVWRLPFEFDDKPGVFKNRPVIVGAIEEDAVEVFIVSVKVTSHPPRSDFLGEVELRDWKEAGLAKPSTARCSHVARLPRHFFKGRRRYGKLSERDAVAVDSALVELGLLTASKARL